MSKLSELVTENKRQNLINQIKKIILEQLKEEEMSSQEMASALGPTSVQSGIVQTGVTAPAAQAPAAVAPAVNAAASQTAAPAVVAPATPAATTSLPTPAAAAQAQPAAVAQSATATPTLAQTQALASQLYPKIKKYLESLNANTYQEMLTFLSTIPPSESGIKYQLGEEETLGKQTEWIQHFAKLDTNNQEFVQNINKITTIGDLRGKVIDLQIAKMNVPEITNRQTYKQYKSIIDNIDNILELITILKTGGTPVAAPPPAAAPAPPPAPPPAATPAA